MNAIIYIDRTGIPWRYLPHEYPPWQSVYGCFAHWQTDGIFIQPSGLLLAVMVTAAGLSDGAGLLPLPQVAADTSIIVKAWVDSAYRTKVIEGGAALGIDVEVVHRDPASK